MGFVQFFFVIVLSCWTKLCCYIIKHCDARFTTALKSLNDTLLTCKFYENGFTSLKVSVMIKSFGG